MSIFVWMCIVLTLLTALQQEPKERLFQSRVFMSAEKDILRARELHRDRRLGEKLEK